MAASASLEQDVIITKKVIAIYAKPDHAGQNLSSL